MTQPGDAGVEVQKSRAGRPRFTPSGSQRRLVESLAGLLVPHDIIADLVGVAPGTLRRAFARELATGPARTAVRLKRILLRAAERGSIRAATWLLERIDPNFRPPERGYGVEVPEGGTMQVIIHGGLPDDLPEAPEPESAGSGG